MIVSKVHHESDINCIKINPKHHDIIASCSDDETIRLWKIEIKWDFWMMIHTAWVLDLKCIHFIINLLEYHSI